MHTEFISKHFNELSIHELYAILQIRMEVFTLEQQCAYQDCDDRDQHAFHLMGIQNGKIVAYSRLLPTGISYPEYCSIGRVLTKQTVRRQLLGKELMTRSISFCLENFDSNIKIGAQTYLEKFYGDFGFVSTGHHYLEDEIPHVSMILKRPH